MDHPPGKRRRAALSCVGVECKRRKVRCSRTQPCEHCLSTHIECTFKRFRDDTSGKNQLSGASSVVPIDAQATVNRAQPAETTFTELARGEAANPSTLLRNSHPGFWVHPGTKHTHAESDIDYARASSKSVEEDQSTRTNPLDGLSQTGWDILKQQSGLQDSQIMLKKTRILRWSDWISTVPEFSVIGDCYSAACGEEQGPSVNDPEYTSLTTQMATLLRKYKALAKRCKADHPSRGLAVSHSDLRPPSRELADSMAHHYFRGFESIFRILHAPTFWDKYDSFWVDPDNATLQLRLKVLLVVSIGSSLHETGLQDPHFRRLIWLWTYASQTWLSGPMEKDRLNIDGIQIHCLTILARQVWSIGGDLAWTSMGSLVHRAMQIGLHRDPTHLPNMTVLQAELRRRLWATILEMTVQTSLDSAMPPRMSFDDFDTKAPANVSDDELGESTPSITSHPRYIYTATSIQLQLLDTLPVRLRALNLLTSLNSKLSYLDILALDAEMSEAYLACSKFAKENEQHGLTPFHRNMLENAVRRFFIPLHAPFAGKARQNPLFQHSLKVCIDTSLAIMHPEPDEDFSQLMMIGSAFLGEGLRCAGSIISFELIAETEAASREGRLHRRSIHREELKKAIEFLVERCLENIRRHVTNIKGHMFMSMVLAHVEAIENDRSAHLAVARCARDSLQLCYGLLQSRIGEPGWQDSAQISPPWSSPDEELFNFDLADLDLDFIFPEMENI